MLAAWFPHPSPIISERTASRPLVANPSPSVRFGSGPVAAPPGATRGAPGTLGLLGQAAEGTRFGSSPFSHSISHSYYFSHPVRQ